MSATLANRALEEFVLSDRAEVLCVIGKWGVGKTYAWNEVFRRNAAKIPISRRRYCYQSLFGIDSISTLKREAVLNITEIAVATDQSGIQNSGDYLANFLRKKLKYVGPALRLTAWGRGIDAQVDGIIRNMILRDAIVVFDDVERRSRKTLDLDDIFGFALYIRDQRNCKVLIILNDEFLTLEEKQKFSEALEKTVDRKIYYAPTPAESIAIGIAAEVPMSDTLTNIVRSLEIDNIRTIERIAQTWKELFPLFSGMEEPVRRSAALAISVYTRIIYSNEIDLLDYTNRRHSSVYTKANPPTDRMTDWGSLLDAVEFYMPDDLDLCISAGVRNGYFDGDELVRLAGKVNERVKTEGEGGVFNFAWRLYHDSFSDNEARIVEYMQKSFDEVARFITPINLAGSYSLMKDLGRDDVAAQLLEKYFLANRDNYDLLDLSEYPFNGDVTDPEIVSAFSKALASYKDDRNPHDVLTSIIAANDFHRKDLIVVDQLGSNDIEQYLRGIEGELLGHSVRFLLKLGHFGEFGQSICGKAVEALSSIAKDGPLNARRVNKFLGRR